MDPRNSTASFLTGLVFGFDVGTSSIGYAVRRGNQFLDVGVLICPKATNDLSGRRGLRRQRRTIRSRKYRRKWFANELEKLGLPRPQFPVHDPIALRLRALNGERLPADHLHAALTHLFRRRGYSKVPWASTESQADKEEGAIKEAVADIVRKLNGRHPCEYLAQRQLEVGIRPTEHWARKIYWPREALRDEFLAIIKAQSEYFPNLSGSVHGQSVSDWLLYGDAREVAGFHVLFKAAEARNPGVLGLRWPRFDNRGPALDAFQPVDDRGHPLHVVRKNKDAFTQAQWALALMNFRVLDATTRTIIDPRIHAPEFIANLQNEWANKGKVSVARLQKLANPFRDRFLLIDNQAPLTPETGGGRARYSSPTLAMIRDEIAAGRPVHPPQPILQQTGENPEHALNRYLTGITHPLVRHRLVLFRRLLSQLVSRFGTPDTLVLEAVRSLALGQKAKTELNKCNEQFRKEREDAREQLSSAGESASKKGIQRYRLWKEAKGRCPFCLETIERTALGHTADIEHIVPRSVVDCNEAYNLTVAHGRCNRECKGDRTPYAAFSHTVHWSEIKHNAVQCFSGRKLELFLNANAEQLVEQKADLQHTAYIARVIRHVALIQLGWLGGDGRDPTPERQNAALRFQVTNGQLTSRLRKAWGLNQILYPLPPGQRWDDLTDAAQRQVTEKNRGDLRHHALDAMVIACTLPWLAHRTHGAKDTQGNYGWWTQDEKQRSKAANPVFPNDGEMHRACKEWIDQVVVRHHVSRSSHQQAYGTTLYARKDENTYVAREVFRSLTPRNLDDIWPKEFAAYCNAAWSRYTSEAVNVEVELKKTKGCLPETFTRKLCFSHFQRWRADRAPNFTWPERVKIPIRGVRIISVKDDMAVVPFSPGTHAYVKRKSFKEVRIHLRDDGKGYVPVFVPYWKGEKPLNERPIKPGSKPVCIIRRGMVVETVNPFSSGQPAGKYRVLVTGQKQLRLLPHHVADKEEAILSFGLGKKGLQPYWPDFIRALGYELPHSPSA